MLAADEHGCRVHYPDHVDALVGAEERAGVREKAVGACAVLQPVQLHGELVDGLHLLHAAQDVRQLREVPVLLPANLGAPAQSSL